MRAFLLVCAFAPGASLLAVPQARGQEAPPSPASAPDPTASPAQPSAPIQRRLPPGTVGMLRGGVRPPVVAKIVDPSYSKEARAKKVSGDVVVHVLVDANGMPTDVRVVQGLGYGLDEKAVEAVQQYQFRPGTKDGVPVPVQLFINVNFRIY